jgi:hypothetical protein
MNGNRPPSTVVLKPRNLGDNAARRIEYTQGFDSTISGSRDALGPLLMGLQEWRFKDSTIYRLITGYLIECH